MKRAARGPLLGYSDMADRLGVTTATLRSYRARAVAGRGRPFPPPDDVSVPDRPRWYESTFDAWANARPGRGAPGEKRSRKQ